MAQGCDWSWNLLPLLVLSWLLSRFIKQISCKKILKIRVEGNPVFVVVCGPGERTHSCAVYRCVLYHSIISPIIVFF